MGCSEQSFFASKEEADINPKQNTFLTIEDSKCKEILEYVNSIKEDNWATLISRKSIKIQKKHGSCFNAEAILSKLTITVSRVIPSKYVLRVLNIPELRLKWDKNLEELTFSKGNGPRTFDSYRKVALFGHSRDFYE